MQRVTIEDPQLQWARDVVARQNRHLTRLIDDLLDVSRITRGTLTLQKAAVELRDVAELAVETVRPLIDSRGHELVIDLPDAPMHVQGDAVRLTQVLANLLTNAAKYTDEGGRVQLAIRPGKAGDDGMGEALICVTDNGRGIPRDAMPRIFEPSTHEERLNSGAHGGLGIGLIVVRGLVEMHGGVVEARSDGAGHGSQFTVRLPLLPAEELTVTVAPARDYAAEAAAEGNSLRILVVDDNQDSAISMTLLLELQGHEVHVAHSGLDALRIAGETLPDVILLDIGMPGMNGYEVARKLRDQEKFAKTLLVAITGYGRTSDLKQTKSAGFDHHLVKPVDYDKLQAVLASRQAGAEGAGVGTSGARIERLAGDATR
jgi:CheY-like chemotaxis protein